MLPEWLLHAPLGHRIACLRGLYDSDGGLHGGTQPLFTNISKNLAEGFMLLAQSCGYACTISKFGGKHQKNFWRAAIVPEHAQVFLDAVRPRIAYKAALVGHVPEVLPPKALVRDVAHLVLSSAHYNEKIREAKECTNPAPGSWKRRVHTYERNVNVTPAERSHILRMSKGLGSRDACRKFLERIEDSPARTNLLDLVNMPWARIRAIRAAGRKPTMDIEIHDKDHSYVGQGLLEHNSGADIVNKAMIKCENDPELRMLGVRLLLQIHDELIFECPDIEATVVRAKARIKGLMENPFPMRVPILVDIGDGYTWSSAKH